MREQIRQAIDAAARARLERDRAGHPERYCAGCGCDIDQNTWGCNTCNSRHWRRRKRADDPAFRLAESRARIERQRRRRAQEREDRAA